MCTGGGSELRERVSTNRRFPQLLGACISLVSIKVFKLLSDHLTKEKKLIRTFERRYQDETAALGENEVPSFTRSLLQWSKSNDKVAVKFWTVVKNHVVGQTSDIHCLCTYVRDIYLYNIIE
uniref:Uncharacterized protein n=1 Tax=Glossina pallidipes TaxID=7398 RepID=A0A1B0ADJ7_GLOPL